MDVTHNEAEHRFEAGSARLEYVKRGERMILTHTEVPPEFEGKGVGGALAKAALGYAREHGFRVAPHCPFVAKYIERHPEWSDLVG